MQAVDDQYCLVDTTSRFWTPLARRAHALADVDCYELMLMSPILCMHSTANDCKPWLMLCVIG